MVIVNEISNTAWTNPLSQETVFYFTLYQSVLMEDLFTVGFMHYVTCNYISAPKAETTRDILHLTTILLLITERTPMLNILLP
jgi:hypothetical protein